MFIDTNIKFTPREREAISVLQEVAQKYSPSIQLYVVGGILRDRILGLESNDLDLMVYPIKAEDFAMLITKHLNIKDPHIIKENPNKSKFISTSKIYLPTTQYGIQEIDIAQARADIYRGDSRIPDTKPSTPQNDMMRRDLTINALAYRIFPDPQELVDFTGMGIRDLITKTIRTPLDPLKTFSDDPLRIFRTIRFTAKYNGNLDPETYKAMSNPELKNEIRNKVSKERVGQEFLKILKNPNPDVAIQLLKDTGLFDDILLGALKGSKYEGKMAPLNLNQNNPWHKLDLWSHTIQTLKLILDKYSHSEPEKRAIMILAALMHDLGKLYKDIWTESKTHPGKTSYIGHEFESANIAELILKYLKIEPMIKEVSRLSRLHMVPHGFDKAGENALRKFIRKMSEETIQWLDVFNLAMADALAKDVVQDPDVLRKYQEIENKLQQALTSLSAAPVSQGKMKPILNGQEVMEILNIKPRAWMNQIMEFVKELRDTNPNISKEEAAKLLKEKYQNADFTKTAEKEEPQKQQKEMSSLCPIPLLKKKIEEVNRLFLEKKYYEVFSVINKLKEEYGNDENTVRLLAIASFKLLLISEEYRYNELLTFIMKKASINLFDHILCSYALGIVILIETTTEDGPIKEIGDRMIKMAPSLLKHVLSMLPQKVFRPKIKKELEKKLT